MAALDDKNDIDDLNFTEDTSLSDFSLDDIDLDDIDIGSDEPDTGEDISSDTNYDTTDQTDNLDDLDNIDLGSDVSFDDEISETTDDMSDFSLDDNLDFNDSMDITKDLGLKESLSLSESIDEDDLSGALDDINISSDESANPISSDVSDDYYGVALKEGPETIIIQSPGFALPDSEELDDFNLDIDDDVVNFEFPEKDPVLIDNEQEQYLTQEISEKSEEDILDDEFDHDIDNISDNLVSEDELLGLEMESSDNEAPSATTIADDEVMINPDADDSEMQDLSLDEELDYNDFDIHLDDDFSGIDENSLSDDDTLELDMAALDKNNDEYDLNTIGEPVHQENDENLDKSFEDELQDDFAVQEEDEEKISLDNIDLDDIEEDYFPDDENMPAVDEDIVESEMDDDNDLTISPLSDASSVFETTDSDDDEKITLDEHGDLSDLNLDDIPLPENTIEPETEDETIGLSNDELDNILNSTDIIENDTVIETSLDEDIMPEDDIKIDINGADDLDGFIPDDTVIEDEIPSHTTEQQEEFEESETIDLNSFNADLSEDSDIIPEDTNLKQLDLSASEEEEIYSSLRTEMKTKDVEEADAKTEALKSDVKNVLSYLDQLLDALPEEKIKEFAESDTFDIYRKLFEQLNIK